MTDPMQPFINAVHRMASLNKLGEHYHMRGLMAYFARLTLWRCQRGATAIEYGFILSLVVLAIIAALSNFANKTTGMWNSVATEVAAH